MSIRIVPLHPEILGSPVVLSAPAKLTYRGGPTIKSVDLVAVFLGDQWTGSQPPKVQHEQITAFLQDIVPSSYLIDTCGEYGIGKGTFNSSAFLSLAGQGPGCAVLGFGAKTQATTSIDDVEIAARLRDAILAGKLPPKTPQTLYVVFVEPGVTVTLKSQNAASCQQFCGYHNSDGLGMFYGVIPYPDCVGCIGSVLDEFKALTSVTTHELAEAVTDPEPGAGWYDDANGENGDICAWQTRTQDGYSVQLEWSNAKGRCV